MIVRRVLFFVLYGVVLLFCLATGSQVLYFVLAAMTGMLLLSLVSLLLVRLRFSLEETVEPAETEAGASGSLSILMANPYPIPFPQLEVEYTLPGPQGGAAYAAAFSVLPLQRIRIREAMALPCRGVYRVGLRTIMVYDVFGLFRMKLPYERLARRPMPQITVLPRMEPPARTALPALESPINAPGAARATEDTSSPSDSRPYRPGDPLKRVHWKLSARQGQLMVKTYEPAAVSDALVYLDTAAAPLEPLDAWYADDVLTAAAVSLAARILQEGVPVRVIYLKDRRMERRLTSLEELPALRRELAALELNGSQGLRSLLSRENAALAGARCAYVLTRELTGPSVDLIAALAQAGNDLRLGLCLGGAAALSGDAQALYHQLEKKQIPIALLTPNDPPAAPLAALL